MCGRFTLAMQYHDLAEELGIEPDPLFEEAYRPRYNIAPTEGSPVLRERDGHRELFAARFGLVNFWAKDLSGAARQINARAETVREKPAFRDAFTRRRCVVPADGFYEWRREGREKTPYWFHPEDDRLFRFAGLYETWRDKPTGHELVTFAIVTTAANDIVSPVHDRMPAILSSRDLDTWLHGPPEQAFSLLRPAPDKAVIAQRASHRVGNVKNDDPSLLREEPREPEMPLFQRSK